MRKLSNRTKVQISLKSTDGKTYFINPGRTVEVPDTVEKLPNGVVEANVRVKDSPAVENIKSDKSEKSNSVKE